MESDTRYEPVYSTHSPRASSQFLPTRPLSPHRPARHAAPPTPKRTFKNQLIALLPVWARPTGFVPAALPSQAQLSSATPLPLTTHLRPQHLARRTLPSPPPPCTCDIVLPFSSLPDKKLKSFFRHSYSSHRLVYKEKGKRKAMKNPTSPALMVPTDIYPHRLIDTHTLQLVEFDKDSFVPPYAILSHTWIRRMEVLYDRFIHPQGETFSKQGYKKIQAACKQARRDGICYIWIDTCCIKQGNHDDVAANITSMYAYYQNAEVCYVYLVDVKGKWDIMSSKWFIRGWTLQELLAPRTVVFFNEDWQQIGGKHELRDDIHSLTTIPPTVISGEQSIQDVDVLTRMTWATRRSTTKLQDKAYCLQGLLGVTVEPNYGENVYISFNRLGKALFDAQPELKERLGINEDLFSNPGSWSFYTLLYYQFGSTYQGR
ncbi:hypothetical protein VKT23_015729 [Stygiomarasmius scandens]|uniref:Heterokaryon incompatibility domain-containing protein n=1 Tax=Marasmiellus scandens TaxID=2682957 RepID=A0ABR1IZL5_9AGAR